MNLLVISPQHGICKEGHTGPAVAGLDSSWIGIYAGEAGLLVEHIRRAVEITAAHPNAHLTFSGGDTQEDAPGRSEALSAFEISRDHAWFGFPEVAERSHQELHARDTGQNLIFSIIVYYRLMGYFPDKVIVVGWGFKGTRIVAHASVLKFLEGGIEYVGVNNPPRENFDAALIGEVSKLKVMVRDKDWMLKGQQWEEQRRQRNPRAVAHPYSEVAALIG